MQDLNIVLTYTTVATLEDAQTLAKRLIESKLAVCVNIMAPHTALYYEGPTFVKAQEVGLLIKIPEERYTFAYEALKGWHPYQLPAILSWPAETNSAYSIWAHQQTSIRY